jgi:hypothetical protein
MSVDRDSPSLLNVEPTRGILFAGQTAQVTISVNAHILKMGACRNVGGRATLTQIDPNGNAVKGGFSLSFVLQLKIA